MKLKPIRRFAAAVTVAAIGGVLAVASQPASAAPTADLTSNGSFPSLAVVRGTDNAIWATAGGAFTSLGGVTYDDPAVAVGPAGVYYLAKGTDGLLWINSNVPGHTGWQLATTAAFGHVAIGTSLTAAVSVGGAAVLFSYLDANNLVHRGSFDPATLVLSPVDIQGPPAFGAAVDSAGTPYFVDDQYFPSELGTGTLKVWNGTIGDPGLPVGLNCALDRLGAARSGVLTAPPYSAIVCRSGTDDSVHFLGRNGPSGLGYGSAHDIGGHIIGSPGVALENVLSVSSVVYVTGTDHHVYSAQVTDLGGIFHAGPFTLVGGVAVGGVQASSWALPTAA
jgi:hypothetical protein